MHSPQNDHMTFKMTHMIESHRNGRVGGISRALASRAEGRAFDSWPSQSNDLQKSRYLSLPPMALGIIGIG